MMSFEEINNYYKFPLTLDKWCPCYINTAENKMAFNTLFPNDYNPDVSYYSKIVQKLNDPTSIDLDDTFIASDEKIISCKKDKAILLVRGWGMLTGVGGYHLDSKTAVDIQDSFISICCERLNTKI